MGVGSLHHPREYDGRLPPDVGYYLDLVLPRKEEPRKKIGSQVRLLHGRILQIRRSIYMQSNPRILVNLLVILVKILVNLLVKLTKLGRRPNGSRRRISTAFGRGGAGKEEADQARREAEDRTHTLQ